MIIQEVQTERQQAERQAEIAGTATRELRQSEEEAERRAVEVEQRANARVHEAEQRARNLEQRIQDATQQVCVCVYTCL